jgi:predicted nucleic acid-binding protein
MKYILDTNAFWEVLRNGVPTTLTDIEIDGKITFGLSQISAMEIYSVLGKYTRGIQAQTQKCTRNIETPDGTMICPQSWAAVGVKGLNKREFAALKLLIQDVVQDRDPKYKISIVGLNTEAIELAGGLLQKYAFRFDFRSLDALIAATSVKSDLVLITRDTKLLNVLKEEGISFVRMTF